MFKKNSILSIAFFAQIAFAKSTTSLRIPIFLDGKTISTVEAVNKALKKIGETAIPEYIEVRSYADAEKKLTFVDGLIENASQKLGGKFKSLNRVRDLYPGEKKVGDEGTCYIGKGMEVSDVTARLTDIIYSEQMGIWAWKYKKHIEYVDEGLQDQEGMDFLNENAPKIWHNWKGNGEAVLILTHVGDGGDDFAVSLIPQCED